MVKIPTPSETSKTSKVIREKSAEVPQLNGMPQHRLKQLFEISQFLTRFESVEKTLPEVFSKACETFPLRSVILIEGNRENSNTSLFHASRVQADHMADVLVRSRLTFGKMMGLDVSEYSQLATGPTSVYAFLEPKEQASERAQTRDQGPSRLILLPLIISKLPPFGAIQIEGVVNADELDLSFVAALVNQIAMALDRHSSAKREADLRQREIAVQLKYLVLAKGQIAELENERELRTRFVATLTHDLRTPLTSAKLAAELLIHQLGAGSAQVLAIRVNRSIDRVNRMIEDLLDVARIHAGEPLSLKIIECDFAKIVSEVVIEYTESFGPRFILEPQKEKGEVIRGFWSSDKIRRMIENLIGNAVKYGSAAAPIRIFLKSDEKSVELDVCNEGNPISAKDQVALFQPFFRTNSAKKGGERGWGLGLSLVRGVVEAHGGQVRIESGPDFGTRFIVTLPRDARPVNRAAG